MSLTLQPAATAMVKPAIGFLSIAAHAFNEEQGIAGTVTEWLDHLRQSGGIGEFEVVVCNDGSRDTTGEVLDHLARRAPEVRPIHLDRNRGAAVALSTAIRHTRGDWVLLIDSDGQFPIANLDKLMAAVDRDGALAAIGVRTEKRDSLFARFGSWSSGAICNWLHGTHCRDFNSALKLVDGALLRSLHLEARGLNYSTEVTSKLLERGVRLVEAEIEHVPRTAGKSSLRALRGAIDRLLFVSYIGLRQLLLRLRILEARPLC
ncbi:MAG TPA: glycosyltransferase family 2 protein [Bryobacteraceae bacterium]